MVAQEVQSAKRKYEEEALEKIREATQVNLAEELIDDELEALTKDLDQQLKKQNLSFDEWAKQSGKNEEEMHKELRVQAEKRLTLRLGLAKIVEERNIEVSDEEMKKTIESFLQSVPEEQRKEVAKAYEKGKQGYDQVLWQKKVEKVFDQIIK